MFTSILTDWLNVYRISIIQPVLHLKCSFHLFYFLIILSILFYPWGKYELTLRSKVSLLTKVLGNFKSIGKINTLPTFLTRLEFSEPRGPFSLETVEILRSQRCAVTLFDALSFVYLSFKLKTDHHFNKNLEDLGCSTLKFSRNSGIEGTKFIDLNRDFLLFCFASDYFYLNSRLCVRQLQDFCCKEISRRRTLD